MNLELNEAGMTFLVGAFVLLSVEAISYFIFGRHVTRFFEGRLGLGDTEAPAALTTGVFIGLSFALGLLVEDASFKYADPLVYRPFHLPYAVLHLAAHEHDDTTVKNAMQYGVLIKQLNVRNPKLTRLGYAVFSSGLFRTLLGDVGLDVESWAFSGGPLPHRLGDSTFGTLEQAVTSVFYFAKNRVYNNAQYYDEMTRIQGRLEFSATIASVSLLAAGCILIIGAIWIPLTWKATDFRTRVARNSGGLIATFIAIYFLAYLAYVQESEEFNKCVFGYYDSMLRATQQQPPSGAVRGSTLP